MKTLKAIIKLSAFLIWSGLCAPTQMVYMLFDRGVGAYRIPYIWQRGVCKIFGLKVTASGEEIIDHQAVYCSNHVSYLDIPVVGSVLKASFVAKADVENWPIFGFLSKLQQTIFISRKRSDVKKEAVKIANSLAEGKKIILFPEGTSSDGSAVLPVKGAMLAPIIDAEGAYVQPFTIKVNAVDGQPVLGAGAQQQSLRDLYAWYGDMDMAPHLWAFAKTKGAHVELVFHAPVAAEKFDDRKALAAYCEENIRNPLVLNHKDVNTLDHTVEIQEKERVSR
ncbi:MAG: lysophospholipid acyltransferase family protein [Pseudomonadota bacterium]|nr:lysophospholipid acyltransferase family protein [Pseudomonadota bacterium]MEC7703459.1 lysophospholipid acyltransferase family protein [Pseudomonadota bacterium]MEC9236633.1 lysophospholipid acyltransferase family protein [Pseudomonadota bacterium]|tara:strand:- start:3767 stop:4603 length:837 start_codon:yes stop_codon:yes gene_type:complete